MEAIIYILVAAIMTMVIYSFFVYKNYQRMQREMSNMVIQLTDVSHTLNNSSNSLDRNLQKTQETFVSCYSNIHNTLDAIRKMKIDETAAFENRKEILNKASEVLNSTLSNSINEFRDGIQTQLNVTQNIISDIEQLMQESLTATKVAVGKTDDTLQQLLESMREHTETQLNDFKRLSVISKDELLHKLNEFPVLAEELRNLTEIRAGIGAFESIVREQNQKFDHLSLTISQLVDVLVDRKSEKSFFSKLTGK